jgi:hypothetical protein
VSKEPQKEAKPVNVEVKIPRTGFPKTMFFNRFRVEKGDGYCAIHFGLVAESAVILDYYCCVLSQVTLDQNSKNLLGYLDKMGSTKEHIPPNWQAAYPWQKADVADIVNMAYRGEVAEITFAVYSIWGTTQSARESSSPQLEAQPLALLRCPTELQKQLITALYVS